MSRHRNPRRRGRSLLIAAAVSTSLVGVALATVEGLTTAILVDRLVWPLARLMLFIAIGLVVGQFIEASGWTRHLAVLARPAFRFGNLGDHCGAAFTTAFFSGTAANAMLYEFYQGGQICRRQLYLANLLNHFPAYFLHLPTTVFIVLPLTGKAGAIYFLLTFGALVLRCTLFLAYGRLWPPDRTCHIAPAAADRTPERTPPTESVWAGVRRKLPPRLTSVAVYVVPIYIAIFMLNALGLFDTAERWLADTLVTGFIPVESLSVVILGFMAEFTSGFAAAGALLDAGVLDVRQTALALLIGNIIAFPVRALRHQLPRYMGIFTPRLGMQMLLLGQSCRVLSLAAVGAVYYAVG